MTKCPIHLQPMSDWRDERHSGSMIERVAKMLFALQQLLAGAFLLPGMFLCLVNVPAIATVGRENDSDDRKGDDQRRRSNFRHQLADDGRGRSPRVVSDRRPKKVSLPEVEERPVSLQRLAKCRQA